VSPTRQDVTGNGQTTPPSVVAVRTVSLSFHLDIGLCGQSGIDNVSRRSRISPEPAAATIASDLGHDNYVRHATLAHLRASADPRR
jgi:hypothetical protein